MSDLQYIDVKIAVAVSDTGAWLAEGGCPSDGNPEEWAKDCAAQAIGELEGFEPNSTNRVVHFVHARVPLPRTESIHGLVPYPIDGKD